jgi:spore coat protein SA
MKRTVFHILPEAEPFSEFRGGALSRWAGNVLRHDDDSVVLCPSVDKTWGFSNDRVRSSSRLRAFARVRKAGNYVPWHIRKLALGSLFEPSLRDLKAGDLIWIHNRPDFAVALSPVAHAAGARVVLHLQNSHLVTWPEDIVRDLAVDRLIFASRFLQREAEARYPEARNATVLYNGADDSVFYPARPENNTPVILFASRLVPEKGVHIFLEAMRTLHAENIAARGIVIGAAHFASNTKSEYIENLHRTAPANVEFHDYCVGKELAQEFRQADAFCFPPIWQEPFGLVNVEAMASGLPVVATRSGGMPEIFAEGGALLVQQNSVPELADALRNLILNPSLRRAIAEQGYASFLRNFTWRSIYSKYRAIVELTANS